MILQSASISRTSDTLVFAPTFNERQTIGPLLDDLLSLPERVDVLIVDDLSCDGTAEYLTTRAATDPRLQLIMRSGKLGVGSAHKLAWLQARQHGYSRLVTLDADLSHDPQDVSRVLALLDGGADVAFGSRFLPGGRLDYSGWRLFLSRSANRVARLLLHLPITEYTNSLRAVRLQCVPPGLVESIADDGYAFFLNSAAQLARHGLTVREIPIHFHDRQAGVSKISKREILRAMITLIWLTFDRRAAIPRPPAKSQDRADVDSMRSAFGGRFIEAGQKPAIAALSACGIALYLAYHLTRFQASAVWPLAPRGDSSIIFDQAHAIFERAAYPSGAIFPYPPSAILIFYGLCLGGPAVFMTAWYFLMAGGLIVCLRASLVQERNETRAAWLLVGLVSILIADAPIAWDLRNANSNLICIGLVMAGYALVGRLPVLAGILVALAFSIKLYSGLLLVYLFLNGPRRATAAAAATVFILWLGLPVGLFGTDGALKLYSSWSDQVRTISDPSLHASLATRAGGPPIVSLQKAVANLTGAEFGSGTTRRWLLAIQSLWLAALLVYAWRCRGTFCVPIPSRAALADWVVLMLAPLPFSPWLEPYHAVPVLVAVLLCVAVALDDHQLQSDRMIVLAALAALLFFIVVKVPFGFRGFGLVAQFFTLVLALAYLRPRLAKQTHQRPP